MAELLSPPEVNNVIEREPIDRVRLERAIHVFHMRKVEMIKEAANARAEEANNHRHFYVGAAVLGVKKSKEDPTKDEYKIYAAGNVKEAEGPKTEKDGCAEKRARAKALDDGCDFIAAVATISEKVHTGEPDEQYHDVLHPCKLCRGQFVEDIQQNFISEDSMLFNAKDRGDNSPSDRAFQVAREMTVKDLLQKYHK